MLAGDNEVETKEEEEEDKQKTEKARGAMKENKETSCLRRRKLAFVF